MDEVHRRPRVSTAGLGVVLLLVASTVPVIVGNPARAEAQAVADGYSLSLVRSGFNKPHAIRYAPDGRLFLLEHDGRVRILRPGGVATALTLDPSDVVAPGGSAGLLSIAFPPDFMTAAVQRVHLVYTHEPTAGRSYPHNVVSRFTITGDMEFGADGSSTWEEVNVLPASGSGANFGWSSTEGYTTDPRFISPVLAYPHDAALAGTGEPHGCAVMGGDVYRPDRATFPRQYRGDYFFADHCEGWMRTIDPDTGVVGPVLATGPELPVDMAVAPNWSVLILQRQLGRAFNGALLRLDYTGIADAPPRRPTRLHPPTSPMTGQRSLSRSVTHSGTSPLTRQS